MRLASFRYGSGATVPINKELASLSNTSIMNSLMTFTSDYNNFINSEKKKFQGTSTFDLLKSLLETNLCLKIRPLDLRYQGTARPLFSKIIEECESIHSQSLVQGKSE